MRKKPFFLAIGINLCLLLLVFFILLGRIHTLSLTQPTASSTGDALAFEQRLVSLVDQSSKYVVSILASTSVNYYMEDEQGNSLGTTQKDAKVGGGSGILCSKKGYVITNKHVVEDPNIAYSVVLHDGTTWNVDKIWYDDQLDLAFLHLADKEGKFALDLPSATFAPLDRKVSVGQFALVIGNSFTQYTNTTTLGIISGKNRQLKINNDNIYAGLYQTDAAINPGNSGGPLIGTDGNVLGIVTAMSLGGNGIGFALPLSQEFIDATLAGIISSKTLVRPLLGVSYKDTDQGSLVDMVFPDTPAAGVLQSGDIITAINNHPITSDMPLLYQLYTYKPGNRPVFTIIRDGKEQEFSLILGGKSK